ncbi:hypothetical protein H0H93_000309, partial [Arthromyces matolae]
STEIFEPGFTLHPASAHRHVDRFSTFPRRGLRVITMPLSRRSSNTLGQNLRDQVQQQWSERHNGGTSSSPTLSRAGLLVPRSYNQPNGFGISTDPVPTDPAQSHSIPHSQDDIRRSTMELSNISFSSTSSIRNSMNGLVITDTTSTSSLPFISEDLLSPSFLPPLDSSTPVTTSKPSGLSLSRH